jgi:hypothetical protein
MTQSSRDKCPPVDDTPVQKEPLSHAGADGRVADARKENPFRSLTPVAKIQLKRISVHPDDLPVYLHRRQVQDSALPHNPATVNSEAICCKVLKNRDDGGTADEESVTRPQLSETELTDREHQRRSMSPFRPGSRVRIIPRRVGEHHTLDKLTLWRRPGPHARQINLWWREHRSEQWYRDMRKQELHSVQYAYLTQATVVSFLVCPESGQRWVALLLDGGRGLGWTYAIDALELV